jgi:membrane protease subunit HflK
MERWGGRYPGDEVNWPEVRQKIQQKLKSLGGKRPRGLIGIVLGVVVVIWLLSGIYIVGPGEAGVERHFGKFVAQTDPGVNYRLPWPIQSVDVVNVAQIRRAEIGFRTGGGKEAVRRELKESLMLTGDENIADIQVLVQYRVKDPVQFLFRVKNPEDAVHSATEVAIRGTVGNTTIDDAMTVGRPIVEADTKTFVQRLLDDYGAGIHLVELKLLVVDPPDEVKDAFHEVVRALEDRERLRKEAEGYAEDVVPKARGDSEKEIRAAEAYLEERVKKAEGDRAKFLKILAEYQKAKDVTKERLYLETIEGVMAGVEKIVIDPKAGGGTLPLLPLRGFDMPERTDVKPLEEKPKSEETLRR